jgi:protein TonB
MREISKAKMMKQMSNKAGVAMRKQARWKKLAPVFVTLLFTTTVGCAMVYFIKSMLSSQSGPMKQIVQQVQIIRPPPPPPEEVPPPPPDQEQVDVPKPEEQPQQADQPPGQQLGVDADASGAGDGFGLLARKGGRDLLESGEGAFAWYTGLLKSAILDRLQDNKKIRAVAYSVNARVWVNSDGSIKVKLASSTGNRELDNTIEVALADLGRIPQAPPLEMPQPVTLKIVSRT